MGADTHGIPNNVLTDCPSAFELPTLRPVRPIATATFDLSPTLLPVQPTSPATICASPTSGPEVNVSLKKPVRVSASWVVDPPEKAVNGNIQDWWRAGGVVPLRSTYISDFSGRAAKQELAEQINTFVNDAVPGTLTVTEPGLMSLDTVISFSIWLLFAAGSDV